MENVGRCICAQRGAGERTLNPGVDVGPTAGEGGRLRGAFTINTYGPDESRPPGTWAYELDEAGVYPVRVRVRDADGDVLTSLLTYP